MFAATDAGKNRQNILNPIGRESRHVGTRPAIVDPDRAADDRQLPPGGAPKRMPYWSVPSVTDAILTSLGHRSSC